MMRTDKVLIFLSFEQSENGDLRSSAYFTTALIERSDAMFGRRNWKNEILIEGPKEARLIAEIENFPDVNPDFDQYPVDLKFPKLRTFKECIKKMMLYSKHGIYSRIFRVD